MTRRRLTDLLLLLAVPYFFFLWKLASFGLIGADEPRYAQVAREMLTRHDWITPTLSGVPWMEKPPLYYWQAMLCFKVFGISDWAARLPSAIDAFALMLAVYWFLRRFRPGLALDGALMLASAAGIVGYARAASMDMPLAASFGIAMLAWFAWFESGSRKYLAAFYISIALAMLAKGPVAPWRAAAIVMTFAATRRSLIVAWKTVWFPGIVIFSVVGFPWYVLLQRRNSQFFHVFIVEHNLARFGTNVFHHPEPFWYYLPVTVLGWVPWAIFVLLAITLAVRTSRNKDADPLSLFLSIWIAAVVILFSISKSKLPGYILPAIAPGIILAAEYVRLRLGQKPRMIIALLHAALSGALMFCALMIQYLVLQHQIPRTSAATVPLIVAVIASAAIAITMLVSGYRSLRLATLAPAVLAVAVSLRFGAPSLDETLSARSINSALSQYDPHHLPVAVFLIPREAEFGLQFYREQSIPRYELGQVPDGEHLVVAAQGYPRGVAKVAGRKAIYLGNFAAQR